jgi:hypothetical protein
VEGEGVKKLDPIRGPWWYGFDNQLDTDDRCYVVGVGGGGTGRPYRTLLWTTSGTKADQANAIVASFAATMYQMVQDRDWEGLEAIKKEIDYQLTNAAIAWHRFGGR